MVAVQGPRTRPMNAGPASFTELPIRNPPANSWNDVWRPAPGRCDPPATRLSSRKLVIMAETHGGDQHPAGRGSAAIDHSPEGQRTCSGTPFSNRMPDVFAVSDRVIVAPAR